MKKRREFTVGLGVQCSVTSVTQGLTGAIGSDAWEFTHDLGDSPEGGQSTTARLHNS